MMPFHLQCNRKRMKCLEPSASYHYDTAIDPLESVTKLSLGAGFIDRTIPLNMFQKFVRKLLPKCWKKVRQGPQSRCPRSRYL
jgi:hypothetical protein